MLCKTELLYWVEIPRAGGDLRTVLPEASAEARTALDLDERGPDPMERGNLKEAASGHL
jgi:hypothetical protein